MRYDGQYSPAYGLTWGCFWLRHHCDESNTALNVDRKKRWVERVLGAPMLVDPIWRYASGPERTEMGREAHGQPLTRAHRGLTRYDDRRTQSVTMRMACGHIQNCYIPVGSTLAATRAVNALQLCRGCK